MKSVILDNLEKVKSNKKAEKPDYTNSVSISNNSKNLGAIGNNNTIINNIYHISNNLNKLAIIINTNLTYQSNNTDTNFINAIQTQLKSKILEIFNHKNTDIIANNNTYCILIDRMDTQSEIANITKLQDSLNDFSISYTNNGMNITNINFLEYSLTTHIISNNNELNDLTTEQNFNEILL
jgi:hypothetical protein